MGYRELIHQRVEEQIKAQHRADGADVVGKKRIIISVEEGKDGAHITYFNAGVLGKNELDISRADLDASLELVKQSVIFQAPPRQEEKQPTLAQQSIAA